MNKLATITLALTLLFTGSIASASDSFTPDLTDQILSEVQSNLAARLNGQIS